MCTLSWIGNDLGYELFFNRDEFIDRAPEVAPVETRIGQAWTLAPRDGSAGGTWLAVNDFGVTIAVLNSYVASRGTGGRPPRSRGLLVLDHADAASSKELEERLAVLDLSAYEPFLLCTFQPDPTTAQDPIGSSLAWDGLELVTRPLLNGQAPLCSSAVDPEQARVQRTAEWTRLGKLGKMSAERLARFHSSHLDAPDAWSPCMHRADAETRSMIHVRVDPDKVALAYAPGAPCRTKAGRAQILDRQAAPAPLA